MRKTEDTLTRARRALRHVDVELDLARTRSDALVRARSRPDGLPDPGDSSSGIEILRHGQRPALPRRRSAVWVLAAAVALLGGAGLGTAALWPAPGEVLPGSPAPISPIPEPDPPTSTPGTGPTGGPSECASTPPPRATPEAERTAQPTSEPTPPDGCDVSPSPLPSGGRNDTGP
jgi:hypothetical protein